MVNIESEERKCRESWRRQEGEKRKKEEGKKKKDSVLLTWTIGTILFIT